LKLNRIYDKCIHYELKFWCKSLPFVSID